MSEQAVPKPISGKIIWRSRMIRLCLALLFLSLALAGALVNVCALGRTVYRWKGLEIELRLLPATSGQTRVELVPLGEIKAQTHRTPVALIASLEHIQVEELQKILAKPLDSDALAQDFERTARASLRDFVLRQVLLGAMGGLLAPILFHSRRFRFYLAAVSVGALSAGIVLGSALTTFNGKAFHNPTYTGTLRHAAWAIKFGRDAFTKFEELSGQLRTIAQNLNTLYGRIDAVSNTLMPDEGEDSIRILHISDIHNNPAAFPFLREVAAQFRVNMIVDTGDLTDFGSPLEAGISREIQQLPYPYVFVPGNHDSPEVVKALSTVPNVIVLDNEVITLDGLRLAGVAHPAAARQGLDGINATPEEMRASQEALFRLVRQQPEPPDIVAVHDPRQSFFVWGRVPLVLCGHVHRQSIEEQTAPPPGSVIPADAVGEMPQIQPAPRTTVVCNAGTTGAAGTRYFDKKDGVPLTCAVLTFRMAPAADPATSEADGEEIPRRPQLYAITLITLDGRLNQYSLSRRTYSPQNAPKSE